jgi:ribonuclease HI
MGHKVKNQSRYDISSFGQGFAIYTDGAKLGNPGAGVGGFSAIVLRDGLRREMSGGYRLTTNIRMELMGCIAGISALPPDSCATLYTDSQYIVNTVSQGWSTQTNSDLWNELYGLLHTRHIRFVWIRGHTGIEENERADFLAGRAASVPNLPEDVGYENRLPRF